MQPSRNILIVTRRPIQRIVLRKEMLRPKVDTLGARSAKQLRLNFAWDQAASAALVLWIGPASNPRVVAPGHPRDSLNAAANCNDCLCWLFHVSINAIIATFRQAGKCEFRDFPIIAISA